MAVPELRARVGTDRFARLCYALGVARLHGRVDAGVIERLLKLVASGGLDSLDIGGEERMAVTKKLAEWRAERDGGWPPPEEELRRLYLEQGLTHQQIADMYGVRREIVGVKLQRLGIVKGVRPKKSSKREAPGNTMADVLAILIAHGAKVRVHVEIDFEGGGRAREAPEPQAQGGGEGAV